MSQRVIVFGASEGGRKFLKNQKEYEVLAFSDNNQSIIGSFIEQFPIISPSSINEFTYDYIVIASMYLKEIKEQLIHELNIDAKKIIIAPKAQMKETYRPFEHENTYILAKNTLKKLAGILNESKIEYFVEFGTLLGLARDGDIIRWDDDIDLSILAHEYERTIEVLKVKLNNLSNTTGVKWEYQVRFNAKKKPRSIILMFDALNEEFKNFTVSIALIYFEKGNAIQSMNSLPESHYQNFETISYQDFNLRVPFNYIGYLELTYGDWKTPNKNLTYEDYNFVYEQGY